MIKAHQKSFTKRHFPFCFCDRISYISRKYKLQYKGIHWNTVHCFFAFSSFESMLSSGVQY